MKYLLFIVLLMAVVIAAGCVGENKNIPVTPTQTAVSSNSGDQAAIAKISEMRNWMMPYMNAIAESLMAHDIIKSGSYAAILRNYIDQNLPEMRQLAEGATTKKAAAREFVAALEDLRTSYDLVVQATNKYNSGDFDGSTSLTYEANDYLNKAAPHLKQYNALK